MGEAGEFRRNGIFIVRAYTKDIFESHRDGMSRPVTVDAVPTGLDLDGEGGVPIKMSSRWDLARAAESTRVPNLEGTE